MIKSLKYQRKAVNDLVAKTIDLLNCSGYRKRLVFKAPTGSGKTVMTSEMLNRLITDIRDSATGHVKDCAFIWIAPNKLHEQSYMKMQNYFTETRVLRPVMYDELDHSADGYVRPGEILFINWESINKDKNLMVRENENECSLYDVCRRTQEHGLRIVVIIDEEHRYATKMAKQSEKVLARIRPKVEIRISATPNTMGDELVNVKREDVIKEEMIKEGIVLNPRIDVKANVASLTQLLLKHALEKRQEIADAYKALGVNINPLLLIQLPDDYNESLEGDDQTVKEEVLLYLENMHGITTDNGKLAVWLSGEKENVDDLEKPDNLAEALLFKQAIALGWDCPRAAVLLIFRKVGSFQFSMQTVGRILRMPEQKHYTNPLLNKGYVYTNLSKDMIEIVQADINYIWRDLRAVRREKLCNVSLASVYREYKSADRNRLGPDFREFLEAAFNEMWLKPHVQMSLGFSPFGEEEEDSEVIEEFGELGGVIANNRKKAEEQGINFNVRSIKVELPKNVYFEPENGHDIIYIHDKKVGYAQSMDELMRIFENFCMAHISGFEPAHSLKVLTTYLLECMERTFGLIDNDAIKVILYHRNKDKFEEVICRALDIYKRHILGKKQEKCERSFIEYQWEVPSERYYNSENHDEISQVKDHALLPFIRFNDASSPEKEFERFLEENAEFIDWWYKNGDRGKQHYSIVYEKSETSKDLFYPDYVIRMKNGQIFLFDTKSVGSEKYDAPKKHNALIKYMASETNKHLNLRGGILIREGNLWKYSKLPIGNTTDLLGWTAFHPDQYAN